jgi:hypothetical protein
MVSRWCNSSLKAYVRAKIKSFLFAATTCDMVGIGGCNEFSEIKSLGARCLQNGCRLVVAVDGRLSLQDRYGRGTAEQNCVADEKIEARLRKMEVMSSCHLKALLMRQAPIPMPMESGVRS